MQLRNYSSADSELPFWTSINVLKSNCGGVAGQAAAEWVERVGPGLSVDGSTLRQAGGIGLSGFLDLLIFVVQRELLAHETRRRHVGQVPMGTGESPGASAPMGTGKAPWCRQEPREVSPVRAHGGHAGVSPSGSRRSPEGLVPWETGRSPAVKTRLGGCEDAVTLESGCGSTFEEQSQSCARERPDGTPGDHAHVSSCREHVDYSTREEAPDCSKCPGDCSELAELNVFEDGPEGWSASGREEPAHDRVPACEACRRCQAGASGGGDEPKGGSEAVIRSRASGRALATVSGILPELGTGKNEEVATVKHHCQNGDLIKQAALSGRRHCHDGDPVKDAPVEDCAVNSLSKKGPELSVCACTRCRGDLALARISHIVREISVWPVLAQLPEEEEVYSRRALALLDGLLHMPHLPA